MSDRIGWSLVGLAGVLGAYASYLFHRRLCRELAAEIVDWFV
ncbi:hypothetical protein ABEV74_15200 [Paenibacillus cisolokensis]